MVSLDKISLVLILSFFGYVVVNLPSGFGAPSQCKDDYNKEELDNYCKYHEGEKPNICREYCQKTRTIDTSYLPPPLDQLNKTLVGQLRVLCAGFCFQNTKCLCNVVNGELNEEISDIKVGSIGPGPIVFQSSVVVGGKNITVGGLLCEDPK